MSLTRKTMRTKTTMRMMTTMKMRTRTNPTRRYVLPVRRRRETADQDRLGGCLEAKAGGSRVQAELSDIIIVRLNSG